MTTNIDRSSSAEALDSERPTQGIRWWPVKVLLVVVASCQVWLRLFATIDPAIRNIMAMCLMILAGVFLALWLAMFSRVERRLRRRILIGGLAVILLTVSVVRVHGYKGDLTPVFGLRPWVLSLLPGSGSGSSAIEIESTAPVDLTATTPHDYPQFLGPRRDGVVRGVRLARDWKVHPPRLLWRRTVGEGWSSFAVVGQHAVTQEQHGEKELVVCYELHTGKVCWYHADPARFPRVDDLGNLGGIGPRATPTIALGRVVSLGATGILNCLDGATGRRLWSVDILEDNQAKLLQWGQSGSPLVLGDAVIVNPGGTDSNSLVAYHLDDGRRLYSGGDSRASYSSPMRATLAGVEQILLVHDAGLSGHDAADGHVLWSHARPPGTPSVTQPVPLAGDRLLIAKGYGVGCEMLHVEHRGSEISARSLWNSPLLKTKFSNLVVRDGHAYGFDENLLTCFSLDKRRARWKERGFGFGQLLLVGDVLLVQGESGEIALVDATPRGFRKLATLEALSERTWNAPALAGRLLLVRNDRQAACYELPVEP